MRKHAFAAAIIAAPGSTAATAEPVDWAGKLIRLDAKVAATPSCDDFMKRLREAGRVLTLPLPPVKIERNPYVTDDDSFWVNYWSPDETGGVAGKDGVIGCHDGKF
jgi:hypothetical protein